MYYCCTGRNTTVTDLGVPDGELHDLLPVAVYNLEEASLLRHLLHDVLRREDGLEVEPLGLHLEPLVDRVLDPDQPVLPLLQPHVSWLSYTSVQHTLCVPSHMSAGYHIRQSNTHYVCQVTCQLVIIYVSQTHTMCAKSHVS